MVLNHYNQFAASTQFYLYGRKHFTRTGWEKHRKQYTVPDLLTTDLDLSEHVYMITGANSGVGKEMAQYLALKKATVYMVCRSKARAEAAVIEITAATGSTKVHVLEGDVGCEADVRRCMQEFAVHSGSEIPRLDALVCNAGALMNDKTLTSEGVEVTFASHLLFGTYLIGSLAMPSLNATKNSRFIAVSSGGMYNYAFPAWDVASSTQSDPSAVYDGQSAYAYAKRGQVLLCERWAAQYPGVKVVSTHPGWTGTPAVDVAYGESKKYLEPMRTPWEGAEAIAWLCVAPCDEIVSGSFYLDRKPQVKHIAGPFFTEGSHTKNTPEQVDALMRQLDDWSNGRRPDLAQRAAAMDACVSARVAPLVAQESPIVLSSFMGRWFVIGNIPTPFDRNTVNNIEEYTYDEVKKTVMVDFSYSDPALTKTSHLLQRAVVVNDAQTEWKLSPKIGIFLPVGIPYLIAYLSEDCSSTIVGVPDRGYVWIMTRESNPDEATVSSLMAKAQALGYDIAKINVVVQDWSKGELPNSTLEDDA